MDPSLGILANRVVAKRNFLKTFCARRCNINQGGNVCRCNGFHFAGKRGSYQPISETEAMSDDSDIVDRDLIYRLLQSRGKISLKTLPEGPVTSEEAELLHEIEAIIPDLLQEDLDMYDDWV